MTHKYIILSDDTRADALKVVERETGEAVVSGISEPRDNPTARQTLDEARRIRDGLEQGEKA
jgi:hypothetical protein